MLRITGIGAISEGIKIFVEEGTPANEIFLHISPQEKALWQHWFETTTGIHVLDFDSEVKLLGVKFLTDMQVSRGTVKVQAPNNRFKLFEFSTELGNGLCQEDVDQTWFGELSDRPSQRLGLASA